MLTLSMKLLLCSSAPHMNDKLEETFLDLLNKPPIENKLLILSTNTTSEYHVQQQNMVHTKRNSKGKFAPKDKLRFKTRN